MMRTGQPQRRLQAFCECGNTLWLRRDGDELVLTSNGCRDRLCQPCQASRRAKLVDAILLRMEAVTTKVRFLTFTLKHCDHPLTVQLDRLLASFKTLRRQAWWTQLVPGGAFFVEVKTSEKTGRWHPHLHVLVEGSYIDQFELSKRWHQITGDSFRVDVRLVTDPVFRANYVTKYATKPASSDVINSPRHLDEFVLAIKGRRLYQTFGAWRSLNLDDDDAPRHLTSIGAVGYLHSQALAGDERARDWLYAATRKWPGLADAFPLPPPTG